MTKLIRRRAKADIAPSGSPKPPEEPEVVPPKPAQHPTHTPIRKVGALDANALLAEINDLGREGMNALLSQGVPALFQVGDKVHGFITGMGDQVYFVNIGAKSEALLVRTESEESQFELGDTVEALVIQTGAEGIRIATKLTDSFDGDAIQQALEDNLTIEAKVTATNSGGYVVSAFGKRGFCPHSGMSLRPVAEPEVFLNKTLTFHVTTVGAREFTVSRRALLAASAEKEATERLQSLNEGDRISGIVEKTHPFGAFVDLLGISGLVPSRFLRSANIRPQSGERLELKIIHLDRDTQKVTLAPIEGGAKQGATNHGESSNPGQTAEEEANQRATLGDLLGDFEWD